MIKRFAILFGALSLSLPLWADITVTPGVGKTVHTDTVNGLEYQVIKIIDGTTGGTSSMTVTAAGAAKVDGSASTQPVTLNQFNAVPVVSTYTTVVSTGLPVTGTFFQVTQPVSIGQANAVPVVSTYTTVVSTGLPVTGTFFQTTQPVSIGQANAVPVVSTYTTVVSTGLPVTGTFFQASQPVTISQSNAVPVTSTYTTVVSTGIPMAGASFNGDTGLNVHLVNGGSGGTSASIPSAFPATVTPVAGINPSGNLATFAVDSSSSINVHITAGGGSGGTSSSIPGTFPATVTPVAGINPSGNMATFAVDSSSGLKLSGQFAIPVTSTYTTVVSTGLPVTGTFFQATQPISATLGVPVTSTYTTVVSTGLPVSGLAAIGTTASGNPVRVGGSGHTALPAAVTDGQIQDIMLDKYGRTVTISDCPRDLIGQSTATLTSTTAETVFISSGGANVFNDIIQVVAVNTSATATRLDFSGRGGPSGQAMSFTLYLPAGDTRGMALGHIWPQNTANANWTVTSSASVSDVRIAAVYCANK